MQRLHIDGWLLLILLALCRQPVRAVFGQWQDWDPVIRRPPSVLGCSPRWSSSPSSSRASWRAGCRWPYLVGVGLLVAVEVMGHTAMGATRWINNIPGVIRFQPLGVHEDHHAGDHRLVPGAAQPAAFKHIVISLVLIPIPFVLILKQPDLGTGLLILASGAFVLFMAGLQWRWIIGAVTAVVPIAVGVWFFVLREYQKQRVPTFLDPESDPLGYRLEHHPVQGRHRLGRSVQQGWLLGNPVAPGFLPEKSHGLYHCRAERRVRHGRRVSLLFVYLLLIGRGLMITVAQAQTLFGKLLAGSPTMTFFVYVFVNIGMVSGLLPVVGCPALY